MPASTVPSMVVKAYVVAGRNRTSSSEPDHFEREAGETGDRERSGAFEIARHAAGCGPSAPRRQRRSRGRATREQDRSNSHLALTAAASCSVRAIPMWPISTKPARRAPAIAPQVLMPYSRLMRSAMAGVRASDDRSRSGSVAPISIVGGSSTARSRRFAPRRGRAPSGGGCRLT